MADTVRVKFTAKPGLYPPHKGGNTWLHEPAHIEKVPHQGAPDKFTTKVIPTRVLHSGDIIELDVDTARTYTGRYECFKLVDAPSSTTTPDKAPKKKGGDS